MSNMIRNKLGVAALAATLVGAVDVRTADAACPKALCGGNGTVLYGQHINGLHVAGQRNADGHRLVPGSIRLGAAMNWWVPAIFGDPSLLQRCVYKGRPEDLRMIVAGGRILVYESGAFAVPTPRKVYSGACLRGATFTVEVRGGPSAVLRIAEIGQTSTWHQNASLRRKLEMYRIVAGDGASICEQKNRTLMESWQVAGLGCDGTPPVCTNPDPHERQWHEETDMAFAASGEVYADVADRGLEVIAGEVGPEWFQFACAGSSVSKLVMMGFDLNDRQRGVRLATMNMLAARYDGKTDMTRTGAALDYQLTRGPKFLGGPDPSKIDTTQPEAYWRPRGAACVSRMRAWASGVYAGPGVAPATEAAHLASLGLPRCGAHAPNGAIWKTQIVRD